jgi:hypothetical protein
VDRKEITDRPCLSATVDSLPREHESARNLTSAVEENYPGLGPMSGYFETRHNINIA